MKKLFFTLSLLFSVWGHVYPQMALLDKTQEYILKKDFGRARATLIIAQANESTRMEARTYYLEAFLDKELFLLASGDIKDSLRLKVLVNAKKSIALDQLGTFAKQCKQLYNFALAQTFNEGIVHFNNSHYKEALFYLDDFAKRKEVRDEHWLDAYYYMGTCYLHLEKLDSAIHIFEFLEEQKYDHTLLYIDMARAYSLTMQPEKALSILTEGIRLYPENFEIQIAELNTLSVLNKIDTLETKLTLFLTKHPEIVDVLLMAATVYTKRKADTEADTIYNSKIEETYKTVLKLDPENFDANYNLGVHFYNRAVELINKQEFDIEIEELTKILEQSMHLFRESLPLLVKTHHKDPMNIQVLKALQAIYYNLNSKDKLSEINSILDRTKT